MVVSRTWVSSLAETVNVTDVFPASPDVADGLHQSLCSDWVNVHCTFVVNSIVCEPPSCLYSNPLSGSSELTLISGVGLSSSGLLLGFSSSSSWLLFSCRHCAGTLLRCPISSSAFKSLRQLSTAATRSPPSSRHRRQSARSPKSHRFGFTHDGFKSLVSTYSTMPAINWNIW